ncbi:MAG: phosphate signaling complex protein PhoU [Chloroflexales bacterium]|nr:phosphate signaling complex protein PhoU [Chloroflexales bacterium]
MRTREHYDAELANLHQQLHELGAMAATAVARALDALARRDHTLAQQIKDDDALVDQAQHHIEERAVSLIALQQPVARDLRRIIAAIAISSELERIADYAKGIARLVIGPTGARPLEASAELLRVGAMAQASLAHVLAAVAANDEAAARALALEEDQIDLAYKPLKARLTASLTTSPDPARDVDLLFIAHNLERIADRATNIAERVIYWASAQTIALNP